MIREPSIMRLHDSIGCHGIDCRSDSRRSTAGVFPRLLLAVPLFAMLALQSTAPLQAQSPSQMAGDRPSTGQVSAGQQANTGQQANAGQAGRAFWGIPALPPPRTASLPFVALPAEPLPSEVELAYYHGAGPQRSDPSWGSHPVGGNRYEAFSPEWIEEDLGLPTPVVAPLWTAPLWTAPLRTAPFPYGDFGASRTKHWQRHFGFRQAYTQWTLK